MANPGTGVAAQFRRGSVLLTGSLFILGAILLWFFVKKAHYVTDISPASYGDYMWGRRFELLLHLSGGVVAITTGLAQLWLGFTGQTRRLHRTLGWVYVSAVAVGVVGGVFLCMSVPGHLSYSIGLAGLDLAWATTTAMAILAIKRRDIAQHRAWMIRSYTVTFAFATYRLFSALLSGYFPVADADGFTDLDLILAWGCWTIPLLLVEVLIQLSAMRKLPARSA